MNRQKGQFHCLIPKYLKHALLPSVPSLPTRPRLKTNHQPATRPFLHPKPTKCLNKCYFVPKPSWIQICNPETAQRGPPPPPFPWNEFSNLYHKYPRSIFTDPDREGPIQYSWEDKKRIPSDHPKNWYWKREKRLKLARDKYIVAYLDEYVVKKGTHPLFLVDKLWFFANGLFEEARVNGIDLKGIKEAWDTCFDHYEAWKASLDEETAKRVEKAERQRAANVLVPRAPHPVSQGARSWPKHDLERAEQKFANGSPKLEASWTIRWQRREETAKLLVELGVGSRRGGSKALRAVKTLARVQLKRIKDANDAESGNKSFQAFGIYGIGRRSWFLLAQECPSAGEIRKVLEKRPKQYLYEGLDLKAKRESASQPNRECS